MKQTTMRNINNINSTLFIGFGGFWWGGTMHERLRILQDRK